MPRLAVIFDCDHRATSPLVLENLRTTIALFGERAEVISVFHSDSAPPPLPGRVLHLTSADIFDAFAHRKARTIIPGNEDLKLIAAAQRLPEFTHFIHHEYDVWHNNPEPELVDRLCEAAIGGTFGASWIRPKSDEYADWMWWPSLVAPPHVLAVPMAAMLPLSFFPASFLNAYRDHLIQGWSGHFEVLMPTLAGRLGVPMVQLGAQGLNVALDAHMRALRSHRPDVPAGGFYHPVKTLDDVPQAQRPGSDVVPRSPPAGL